VITHATRTLEESTMQPSTIALATRRLALAAGVVAVSLAAAAPLRAYSGARNNQDLSELLVFHTDALRDLQQRCGGNPFDNRQTLYTLGSESAVVNAGVERYSAESVAEACARNLPRPTAKLTVPFLAVDAAYDPVVPAWSGNQYASEIESAGKREWFVRQFVSEQGHCAINTESRLSALRAMVRWVEQGIRPLDGRQ